MLLSLPPMYVFLFLTLQALDLFLYIYEPNFMLISFSYIMLHFTQIAEVGKYLSFLKILSARRKSTSKQLELISFVGFQRELGQRPREAMQGGSGSSHAGGSRYKADSASIAELCWRSAADSLSQEIKESPDGSGLKCF